MKQFQLWPALWPEMEETLRSVAHMSDFWLQIFLVTFGTQNSKYFHLSSVTAVSCSSACRDSRREGNTVSHEEWDENICLVSSDSDSGTLCRILLRISICYLYRFHEIVLIVNNSMIPKLYCLTNKDSLSDRFHQVFSLGIKDFRFPSPSIFVAKTTLERAG